MFEGTHENRIPRWIEPRKFAHQKALVAGSFSVDGMNRIAESGLVIKDARAVLQFGVGDANEKILTGRLQFTVQRECQRCLEPVDVKIDSPIALQMLWKEQDACRADFDPWVVPDEKADLYELMEEEILLAVPFVAYHETQCGQLAKYDLSDSRVIEGEKSVPDASGAPSRANPFDVLRQLKNKEL